MRIDENTDIDGTRTVVEHHGDGTGTRTVYDADGNIVDGPTAVDGLPVEVEAPPDQDVPIDADLLAGAEAARRAAYDAAMSGGTLSMARLREADRLGSEAFLAYIAENS